MKLRPAPEKWQKAFDAALPDRPEVERRKMFGYSAAFVNGNMATGLHEHGLVLRLPHEEREKLVAAGGRPFEPMKGRVMKEYTLAPDELAPSTAELRKWIERSLAYAGSLPKKAKTGKKAKK